MPPRTGTKANDQGGNYHNLHFRAACSMKIRRILMLANAVMDDIHGICRFQNTQTVTQYDY